MKFLLLLNVFIVVNYVHSANFRVDPLVLIGQGLVRGQKATDGDYSSFLGIPYAQVDLNNPFGPSQEHPGFEEEIYNAYDGTKHCPQMYLDSYSSDYKSSGEETLDCLRLNIYVPNAASSSNPLPVLVWIHGGAFIFGSAGQYGATNLVKHGVVVVTVNYRLGPYGFMCLDVPSVPGNQGLKDQYTALRWIRNNIAAFGGNPYNVTLAGQSAGSASVLLHLYSAKEKLFHKIIAESGTPQSDGLFVNADVDAAIKLAGHLGLNTTDTDQALEFLAQTSHDLVIAATKDLGLELRPCKERSFSGVDIFVESDPYSLSNERKIRNTPILIGHTSKEAIGLLEYFGDNLFKTDPFYITLAKNFNLNDDELNEAANIVRHFYTGDETLSMDLLSELEDFVSDFTFNHPVQRAITSLVAENANPVYQYLFNYVGNTGTEGAPHSAELFYLFEFTNINIERSEEDQLILDRTTTLWTNFVKYGNPTPKSTDLIPLTWEAVTQDNRPYLVIDTDIRMERRVFKERMAFWDLFYTIYGKYNSLTRECSI